MILIVFLTVIFTWCFAIFVHGQLPYYWVVTIKALHYSVVQMFAIKTNKCEELWEVESFLYTVCTLSVHIFAHKSSWRWFTCYRTTPPSPLAPMLEPMNALCHSQSIRNWVVFPHPTYTAQSLTMSGSQLGLVG